MSICLVNIHGDIEGDYEIIKEYQEREYKAIDDSFMKAMGNNRVTEACNIKEYCARQKVCRDCSFYNDDENYSICRLMVGYAPEHWDLDDLKMDQSTKGV